MTITLTREEAQQVLDALEHIQRCIGLGTATIHFDSATWHQSDAAIETLRARLAQPEPEPVAWGVDEGEGRCISLHDLYFVKADADHMAELKGTHAKVVPLYTTPPQRDEPEPEPPRFPTVLRKMWSGSEVQAWIDEHYTAPPQRQWQGLTDEEVEIETARVLTTLTKDVWPIALSRAIEKLLRRKNT